MRILNISVRQKMMIFVTYTSGGATTYPNLAQIAFNLLAILSYYVIGVWAKFSKPNYTIFVQRSSLGNNIVKAAEILRSWVSVKVVILSTSTADIVKDEPELDIARIPCQNVWVTRIC